MQPYQRRERVPGAREGFIAEISTRPTASPLAWMAMLFSPGFLSPTGGLVRGSAFARRGGSGRKLTSNARRSGGKRPSPIAGDAVMGPGFVRPLPLRSCFAQRRNFLQTMAIAVGSVRTMLFIAHAARARSRRGGRQRVRNDVACARAGWDKTGVPGFPCSERRACNRRCGRASHAAEEQQIRDRWHRCAARAIRAPEHHGVNEREQLGQRRNATARQFTRMKKAGAATGGAAPAKA
jgi:hypothetical protein